MGGVSECSGLGFFVVHRVDVLRWRAPVPQVVCAPKESTILCQEEVLIEDFTASACAGNGSRNLPSLGVNFAGLGREIHAKTPIVGTTPHALFRGRRSTVTWPTKNCFAGYQIASESDTSGQGSVPDGALLRRFRRPCRIALGLDSTTVLNLYRRASPGSGPGLDHIAAPRARRV